VRITIPLAIVLLSLIGQLWLPVAGVRAQANGGFKVIVNAENPTTTLSKREVSNLFLKKARTWQHGERVAPVDQPVASPLRDLFSKAIIGRSAAAVRNHWAQSIFSGKDSGPPELADDEEIIAFVADNPGAIGYVASTITARGVKVVVVSDF
jgi:ABC-type phosphate transport system substrate-binding protein